MAGYGVLILGLLSAAHASQTNTFSWSLLHVVKTGLLRELRKQTSKDLLKAVFRETGRLYSGLIVIRRVVNSQHILGKYIPAGTYVACSPLITSHDPKHFPDPERFRPQRWLTAFDTFDEPKIIKMQRLGLSNQFGKGPHKCLGQKLAKVLILDAWWPMLLGDGDNPGYEVEIVSGTREGIGFDNVGVEAAWVEHNSGTPFQKGENVCVRFSKHINNQDPNIDR